MVTTSWKAPLTSGPLNHLDSFSLKLGRLKSTVKSWERKKTGERKQLVLDINDEIFDILHKDFGLLSTVNSDRLRILQDRKGKYWAHEITSLRLRSRVL